MPVKKKSIRTFDKVLTRSERAQERMRSMVYVFQQADTILAGKTVRAQTVNLPQMPAAGWSDESGITFNMAEIESLDSVEDMVALYGLNYHELGHVMFTPMQRHHVAQEVDRKGWRWAFNVLEDIRLEAILTSMYPSTMPYFTAMFMKWVLGSPEVQDTAYPFVYGRKYLPQNIRDDFRKGFILDEADTKRFEAIEDEYRTLTIAPGEVDRTLALIEEFHELFNKMQQQKQQQGGGKAQQDPHGHDQDQPYNQQRGGATSQQKAEQGSHAVKKADQGENDSYNKAKQQNEDAAKGSGSGDGEGGDEGQGGEDGSGEANPGPGIGQGTSSCEDLLNHVLNDQGVLQEATEAMRSAEKAYTPGETMHRANPNAKSTTTQEEASVAKRLGTLFEKLAHDIDPGWDRHKPSGRLNVQRAMHSDDIDELFDEWNEGNNLALDIEAVILVDDSGSMGTHRREVAGVMWAIKRSLDKIGAATTVIGFDDGDPQLIYGGQQKALPDKIQGPSLGGGTAPYPALFEAKRIFHYSGRRHRMMFILSDGQWYGAVQCEQAIEEMNRAGIMTTAIHYAPGLAGSPRIDYMRSQVDSISHKAQHALIMTDLQELIGHIREVVTAMARNPKMMNGRR